MSLRTVQVLGADRRPGERMPPLSQLLKPAAVPALVIDRGVPLPAATKGKTSAARATIEQLEPGDSVLVPTSMHSAGVVRLMARSVHRKSPERTFTSRTEAGGTRVWRVS